MKPLKKPSYQEIERALHRIRPWVPPSPLVASSALSSSCREVRLKLESLCPTGSFKVRGVTNALVLLSTSGPPPGVLTQSSGNHGRALAYVARRMGMSATVCLSDLVPQGKRRAIEHLGARVVIQGSSQDEAWDAALALAAREDQQMVPAFDHPDIICGQGTVGAELLQEWPEVETILVPLSGGGLASGVAIAAKAINPKVRVLGVTVDHGAAMADSLRAGKVVGVGEQSSYADALPGGIPMDNRFTFGICQNMLDGVLQIPESAIAEALLHSLTKEHLVLEGAGAIGLAPLLDKQMFGADLEVGKIAVVCSGGNVDWSRLLRLIEEKVTRGDM